MERIPTHPKVSKYLIKNFIHGHHSRSTIIPVFILAGVLGVLVGGFSPSTLVRLGGWKVYIYRPREQISQWNKICVVFIEARYCKVAVVCTFATWGIQMGLHVRLRPRLGGLENGKSSAREKRNLIGFAILSHHAHTHTCFYTVESRLILNTEHRSKHISLAPFSVVQMPPSKHKHEHIRKIDIPWPVLDLDQYLV